MLEFELSDQLKIVTRLEAADMKMLQFYHRVTFTENIFIGRVPGKQFEEPDYL